MHARRSQADWAKLISDFTATGGSPAAFCARRSIKLPTFNWWRSHLRATRAPAPAVELVPVAVVDAEPAAASVVVALADVEVRVTTGTDVRYVAALVEALRRC